MEYLREGIKNMAFAEFELGTNQLVMWRLSGREPRQTAVLEPTATVRG